MTGPQPPHLDDPTGSSAGDASGSKGLRGRNVLLITTDQERWFSEDPVELPAHRWLRRHGTTFDRFYAAGMACSPARSVIYTGQHTPNTGVIDNLGVPGQGSMRTEIPTLATMLAARGYRCGYKGKWHLSDEAHAAAAQGPLADALVDFGFADYNDSGDDLGGAHEGHRRDESIARDAVGWLASVGVSANASGTPWCLAVNLINPHDIMWAVTDAALLDERRAGGGGAYAGPPDDEIYRATWDLPDDPTWLQPIDSPTRPAAHHDYSVAQQLWTGPPAATRDELVAFRDYYLNCLREVDRSVMSVIEGLEAAGLGDDTVIVFTSDHGELAGAHGLFGKGPCAYDANIRIPLIVVDPQRPGGQRTRAIGSQVDLVPTVLSLAAEPRTSAPAVDELVGVDLSEAMDQPDGTGPRDGALFVYESLSFVDGDWATKTFVGFGAADLVTGRDLTKRGFLRTIITDQYKYTRYFAPGEHHRPRSMEELSARNTLELFDLEADPDEMVNLAGDPVGEHGEVFEHLDGRLSLLISSEVGEDDGHWLPDLAGAPWMR